MGWGLVACAAIVLVLVGGMVVSIVKGRDDG
jgi:hypothetical protein